MITGANAAWAATGDVTTNVDIDFSSAITGTDPYTIAGTVSSMTWTQQWTMVPNITDGILQFGNFNGGKVELQNNTIGAKDVVTITFDMAFGKLNGRHVGFDLLDTDDTNILTQWFDAYNGDFDDSNPLGLDWNKMYRGSNTVIQERCVYFTIKLDYAAKTITTNTKCYLEGTTKAATEGEFTASLPSDKPLGAFVLQGNINNTGRYSTFDNLKITTTEGDYTVATANYTVNWTCGNEIIKTETREGDQGASIILTATDKANFSTTDGTKRYIYESDNSAESVIAADGSTVVNISFREAAKYNYTITSSYNSTTLDWSTSGSVWEDQNSINAYYPRYQAIGSTLVGLAPNGNDLKKSFTITEDGFTADLEYTSQNIDNLYLLSEAENLGTSLPTNGTTFTDRVSNRAIIYGTDGTLLTLPAGKYIFTLGVIGGDTNSHKVAYTVKAGEEQIAAGDCTGNFLTLIKSGEFTLTTETAITFTCSDPASSRGIDLVYVQKTGEATIPATISSAGWATLYTDVALDFSDVSGLTAYTAACDGQKVTLTEVENVPAGTGVVLQGAAGDYSIPVIASSETAQGDLKGSTTEGKAYDANGTTDVYILVLNDKNEAQFTKMTEGTLAAGKAYLELAGKGARLNVVFEGETTGISTVAAAEQAADTVYSLSGQRVATPKKGLYIVNGKKMIIK